MKSPHVLRASSNMRKLTENLAHIVDTAALEAISREVHANVAQLFALGRNHFHFAMRQNNRAWRQKISRFYYAAYNVSRAVRLCVSGEYSIDSSDHKKIEAIPEDFPNKNRYANRLGVLREDRKLCDYDHTAKIGDLVVDIAEAEELVESYMLDARLYLKNRGVRV